MQRPSAKELLRHPFIKKAKKNSYLMDLIDRYRKWKITRGDETDSDSGGESGADMGNDDSDTDWNMTVKGPPADIPSESESSAGYSEPVNSGPSQQVQQQQNQRYVNGSRERSPPRVVNTVQQGGGVRSPHKEPAQAAYPSSKQESVSFSFHVLFKYASSHAQVYDQVTVYILGPVEIRKSRNFFPFSRARLRRNVSPKVWTRRT